MYIQFRSHKIQRILGTRLYTCTKSAQFILNPPFACIFRVEKEICSLTKLGREMNGYCLKQGFEELCRIPLVPLIASLGY